MRGYTLRAYPHAPAPAGRAAVGDVEVRCPEAPLAHLTGGEVRADQAFWVDEPSLPWEAIWT